MKRPPVGTNGNPTALISPDQADTWHQRIHDHRRRQASVSAILDQSFGRFAESDPSLWDRRAYLMLVGIVYERLACDEACVPTEELISLAKLLAESRRADTQARDGAADKVTQGDKRRGSSGPARSTPNEKLPDAFSEVVRQIYGATVSQGASNDQGKGVSGVGG